MTHEQLAGVTPHLLRQKQETKDFFSPLHSPNHGATSYCHKDQCINRFTVHSIQRDVGVSATGVPDLAMYPSWKLSGSLQRLKVRVPQTQEICEKRQGQS